MKEWPGEWASPRASELASGRGVVGWEMVIMGVGSISGWRVRAGNDCDELRSDGEIGEEW